MNNMQPMDRMQHTVVAGSFPFLEILAGFFLIGALFYCFRLYARKYVTAVNGYHDRENELWHCLCMIGMVGCLEPGWYGAPNMVWQISFAIGTIWYLVRAFTFGRKLPYNKQWYDFAHAAMLFGMWWMFASPINSMVATTILTIYWIWFGSYYAMRLYHDCQKIHWLSLGQDMGHFVMAIVMALMMIFPATFMGNHQMMSNGTMQQMPICTSPAMRK